MNQKRFIVVEIYDEGFAKTTHCYNRARDWLADEGFIAEDGGFNEFLLDDELL